MPHPLRTSWSFGRAFLYPLRGFRFVFFEHPGLIRLWIVPIVATGLALAGGGYVAVAQGTELASEWTGGDGWMGALLFQLLRFLLVLVLGALALLGALLVAKIVAAPFNSKLSEEVESLSTGAAPIPFSWAALLRDVSRTLRLEVLKIAFYLSVMLPLFVLQWLLPAVGSVLYAVFGFFFTAWYFGMDYLDWPAERRGLRVRDRLRFARAHLSVYLGFGAAVSLLMAIPFLNLFFMPAAVAGGTLLYLDLTASGDS